MFQSKISVLMPVHNGEPFIKESIESILNQTFTDFEFIIVDDGSFDNTFDIISEYAKIDDRIRVFRNEENKKIVYTLNKGLRNATSSLIARMDCGDVALTNRLEKQYAFLSERSEYILISSQICFKNLEGEIIYKSDYPCDDKSIRKELFLKNNVIAHPAAMFRRTDNILYREFAYPAEDYDLWLRLAHLGKMAIINEYLMVMRLDPGSISFSNMIKQIKVKEVIHRLLTERLQFGSELSTFDNYKAGNANTSCCQNNIENYIENLYQRNVKKIITLKKGTFRWMFLAVIKNILYPQIIKYKLSILLQRCLLNLVEEKMFVKFLNIKP